MQPLTYLGSALLRTLRDHLRPLIAFHLFFTLLASALLLPAITWITRGLLAQLNRTVVTNDELIALLFSPLGLVGMLVGLGFAFLIIDVASCAASLTSAPHRLMHGGRE